MTISSASRRLTIGRTARSASAALLVLGLVAACGGAAPKETEQPGSTAGSGSDSTPAAVATSDNGGGGGGGGTGGGANPDVDAAAQALVPPNSTEVQKTSASGTFFGIYSSTDSIDSLKSYYQNTITKAGFKIISTTTVSGGVSFVFATDDSGTYGGAVNVYPSGDGAAAVQVTVSQT